MITSTSCRVLAVLVLALGLGSAAFAATSGPFTTSTPIAYTLTDWAGTLAFPKFDSSLGTLYQVDIQISAAMRTTLTVTNTASTASSGTAKTEVAVTVSDPLSLLTVGPDFFSPNYPYSLAPGATITSGVLTKSGMDAQSFTDPAILAEYAGPGTIIMNASTYTQAWISYNGGNTEVVQVTDASTTGTITYWYDPVPVPEPAGLMALGSALLGMVAFARRRK